MPFPAADTPLYNHTLPAIENWLISLGCQQNPDDVHCWQITKPDWSAEIYLDTEELVVHYQKTGEKAKVTRSFKYSLSRADVESALLAGP